MGRENFKILEDGTRKWFYAGLLHRTNGPAVVYPSGSAEWYLHGKLHRTDGPATVQVNPFGFLREQWYQNGSLHRVNGPAIITGKGALWWGFLGRISENVHTCQKAANLTTPVEELFELCQHEDFVVRGIAAMNPNCPEEGVVIQQLLS